MKNNKINQFAFVFGPFILGVSLFLHIFPKFDANDVPSSKSELYVVTGTVASIYTRSSNGNSRWFIKVFTGDDIVTLKSKVCCIEWLEGREIEALVYPDFLRRWFDIAWEINIKDGHQLYSYESERESYFRHVSNRRYWAKWGLVVGLFFTPIWYLTKETA